MSRTTTTARARMLEVALWLVAVVVALTLLVPSAYKLHAAHQEEVRERAHTAAQEKQLHQAEQELEWLVHDPLTDQRLIDTQGVKPRRPNATGEPKPTE